MARLVLEIKSRHEHRYVPLDKPLIRFGRALDNDVILTDPTVSPHHFVIKRSPDDSLVLHSLSDENGMQLRNADLAEPLTLGSEPIELSAGRTQLRILPADHPVAPTRPLSCSGGKFCLFGSWSFAWGLFLLFLVISAIDNLLATPEQLTWESFGRDQTVIILVVLTITGGLALLVKLTSQHWEIVSALSFVCLMLLLATAFDQAAIFSDYFFTTNAFGLFTDLAWSLIIAPAALLWFFIKINHGNTASSVIITFALLTPAAYFTSQQIVTHYGWFETFSKKAFYPEEIYPVDLRRGQTLSIEQYLQDIRASFADD